MRRSTNFTCFTYEEFLYKCTGGGRRHDLWWQLLSARAFFCRKHAPAATQITFLAGARWRHRFLQLFHPETYTAVDASEVPNQGFPYTSFYDFLLCRARRLRLSPSRPRNCLPPPQFKHHLHRHPAECLSYWTGEILAAKPRHRQDAETISAESCSNWWW
jgi:hypothetical protein